MARNYEAEIEALAASIGEIGRLPVAGNKYERRERSTALARLQIRMDQVLAEAVGGGAKDASTDAFRAASQRFDAARGSHNSADAMGVSKLIKDDTDRLVAATDSMSPEDALNAFLDHAERNTFDQERYPRPADLYGADDE
jgi:hypothetical protein